MTAGTALRGRVGTPTGTRLALAMLVGATLAASAAPGRTQPPSIADVVADWTTIGTDAERFRLEDGVLRVTGGGGWLRSERRYADFTLTAELRFLTEDADSGLFVRAEPDAEFGRGWPRDSYQIQLRNPLGDSPFPPIGGLFRHAGDGGATHFDETAVREAFTGTGEWQTVVVDVAGDTLRVAINGVAVTEADGLANASGHVGIQSETGALELRMLTIEAD